MPLAATSSTLYLAQRKRLRFKRLRTGISVVSKCFVVLTGGVALVLGLSLAGQYLQQSAYFQLRKVQIRGTQTLTEQEVRHLLALPPQMTLWQLDLPRMGQRLGYHPAIKTVDLRRQFPDTLTVTIREHTPYLVVRSGEQLMVVDTTGTIIRSFLPAHDGQLPELVLSQDHALVPGLHLSQPEISRALELVHAYHASPLATDARLVSLTVQASGASDWRVEPQDFIIRVGEGQVDQQLKRLPLVLRYIAQQNLAVRVIDVSYRKRIVVIPAS